MSVMCAWASSNERGKLKGGNPGDQTGREVKCGSIYNFGQTRVYRCTNRSRAVKIGAAAKAIAGLVSDEELNEDFIMPEAFDPRVAEVVSQAVKSHIR